MLTTKDLRKILKTPEALKGVLKDRPDWDSYFMSLAYFISTRSSCSDRMTGAVLVANKTIIATGFNGAPRGVTDCLKKNDCIRENRDKSKGKDYHNCYAAHAEVNALANHALMGGSSTLGSTLYSTVYPCTDCARQLINAGISKIFYAERLPNDTGLAPMLFEETGIICEEISKEKIAAVMHKSLEHLVHRDEKGRP